MNFQLKIPSSTALLGVALASTIAPPPVRAQRLPAQTKRLLQYVQAVGKIPAEQQKHLSGGALNLLSYAERATARPKFGGLPDAESRNTDSAKVAGDLARLRSTLPNTIAPLPLVAGVAAVSNPKQDFVLSVLGGFTQSETTTAWCGSTVVVGYNDSGSYLRTAGIDPLGAYSFNGVAASFNEGATFKALDYLNPGPDPIGFLGGDPVVACSSPSSFKYSSLFSSADSAGNPLSAVSVSGSESGGAFWGTPSIAASKDGNYHTLDKDWMTIDPKRPKYVYVTYTDFDGTGTSKACPDDFRTAIELVASKDGGSTWGAPVVIRQECEASGNFVQGSQVVVGPTGRVSVAYEFFANNGSRAILLRGSDNSGGSFGDTFTVTPVTPTGDGTELQGNFRTNEFPSLAADPLSSDLYVSWTDARNNIVPDLGSLSNSYGYGDVFVTRSSNAGRSWSPAVALSPTPASFAGTGRDQFMPGVSIDHAGNLGVCYYDRRRDPSNQAVDRYCSVSKDHGSTWTDSRKTVSSWIPVHDADVFISPAYMGDYDVTTSDTTGANAGFLGAFQIMVKGNPDVFAARF